MKSLSRVVCIALCGIWVCQSLRVSPNTRQKLLSRLKRQAYNGYGGFGGYGGGYSDAYSQYQQEQQDARQAAYDQQQQYQQQQQDMYDRQQQYQQEQEKQYEQQEQQYEQQQQQYEQERQKEAQQYQDQQRDYEQQREDEAQQRYQQQMDSYNNYGRYKRATDSIFRVKRQGPVHHGGPASPTTPYGYPSSYQAATPAATYSPVSIYELNFSMCRYLLEIILSLLQDEYAADDTQTVTPLETDPIPPMQPGLVVATAKPLTDVDNGQNAAVPADVAQIQLSKTSDDVQVDQADLDDDTDLMIDIS